MLTYDKVFELHSTGVIDFTTMSNMALVYYLADLEALSKSLITKFETIPKSSGTEYRRAYVVKEQIQEFKNCIEGILEAREKVDRKFSDFKNKKLQKSDSNVEGTFNLCQKYENILNRKLAVDDSEYLDELARITNKFLTKFPVTLDEFCAMVKAYSEETK